MEVFIYANVCGKGIRIRGSDKETEGVKVTGKTGLAEQLINYK
ncbi:hypothetical protein SAMN05428949_6037 [Chitinophaga sp. YR627]|nr:hypothetical protein SAMN05428949_6037 [Chitinophaga sp. YR627]